MIRGRCRTNIDGVTCDVDSFVSVPRIGDFVDVRCFSERNRGISYLKVCKITHKIDQNREPYIEVELTK